MISVFEEKREQNSSLAEKSKNQINWFSWIRVGVFIVSLVLFYIALQDKSIGLLFGLVAVAGGIFIVLVKQQNMLKEKLAMHNAICQINNEEIARKEGHFKDLYDAKEYLIDKHSYAYDLDILGEHSLYQLVNRSTTHSGRGYVAGKLLNIPPTNEIHERQQAVKELKGNIDWRQTFQSYGMVHPTNEKNEKALQNWLTDEALPIAKNKYKKIAWGLSLLLLLVTALMTAGIVTFHFILLSLAINALVLLPHIKKINARANELTGSVKLLSAYAGMLKMIEDQKWQSPFLTGLQSDLKSNDLYASYHISRLRKLMDYFDGRGNLFYQLLNGFFLLDFHLLHALENWKVKHENGINLWIRSVSELELTSSLAAFAYANPDYAFPELQKDEIIVDGKNLGHPLIIDKDRVSNNFRVQKKGSIALITGSNMAGKSTFLRTVGINIILAQTGGPVCADEFLFSPCKVFTSMRTKDNLNESISSFYAELLRIKALLDSIDDNQITFFLLDEILKGTNSKDRHKGAMSLIRQLSKQNAFGLVSTHDLELGELSKEVAGLENYSFESHITGEEIFFDYKLKKGLCKSFNASKLMGKMGIEMEEH